ncbi:MAG: dTMP kinase [Hyphomicrobiaceae bacterium]
MRSGQFITFEGVEGVGKSTQARLLADRLKATGQDVIVTREPGGTPLAEKIRDLILEYRPKSPEAEFLLFSAARAEHLSVLIRPALEAGKSVICDRFIDSTRVYQGEVFGVAPSLIRTVEQHIVAATMPVLTIILDLDPTVGLERAAERGTLSRYDEARIEVHRVLRQGFLNIASTEPSRCAVVDAARPADAVAADVWAAVEARLATTAE